MDGYDDDKKKSGRVGWKLIVRTKWRVLSLSLIIDKVKGVKSFLTAYLHVTVMISYATKPDKMNSYMLGKRGPLEFIQKKKKKEDNNNKNLLMRKVLQAPSLFVFLKAVVIKS